MSVNRGTRTPAGFVSSGTKRNTLRGALTARRGNPWGNPCPSCGAKRYERCFRMHRATVKQDNGQIERVDFIYIKDKTCAERVTWYLSGNNEGDDIGGDDE